MTLGNINTMKKDRGFTIVELLIVIVIIAILAAITIVAYNGIQNRAKTSSGQELANQISKKAQAYNTLLSQYPTFDQLQNNKSLDQAAADNSGPQEARLDDKSKIQSGALADGKGNGQVVGYEPCGTTGAKITYWDYAANPQSAKPVTVGTGCQ